MRSLLGNLTQKCKHTLIINFGHHPQLVETNDEKLHRLRRPENQSAL